MKYVATLFLMVGILGIAACGVGSWYSALHSEHSVMALPFIQRASDIPQLFPTTPAGIAQLADEAIEKLRTGVAGIVAIPAERRTFTSVVDTLDQLTAYVGVVGSTIHLIQMTHPDAAMRDAAQAKIIDIQNASVDCVGDNYELYSAVKAVADAKPTLAPELQYYLDEMIKEYERGGMQLAADERAKVATLKKKLAQIGTDFDAAIARDVKTVTVSRAALEGVEPAFIATLPIDDAGNVTLTIDYPTVSAVLGYCRDGEVRKKVWLAFNSRAYPKNEATLDAMIAQRDELAQLLGFKSFSHYSLASEMAQSPERVTDFLGMLAQKARPCRDAEFEQLVAELPEGVKLTDDRKLLPWDSGYVSTTYEKKHFNLDAREIAQYFPMQKALTQMLKLYEQFLGIQLIEEECPALWHPDLKLLRVADEQGQLLGFVILDLFPRPNKYTHACNLTVVPTVTTDAGVRYPAVSVVIANFTKPTADRPSLLRKDEVSTFFHEFGHAMHGVLGSTRMAGCSGYNTKTDFVELPSQMLEEWMDEPAVLAQVSGHYQTGEPLPQHMIDTLVAKKNFGMGGFVMRQSMLAHISMEYFAQGCQKDRKTIRKNLHEQFSRGQWCDDDNFDCAFGHLHGYNARYYGYLWSKVFALDLFDTIKKAGMGPEIGKKYVAEILSKGGSVDPNQMLKNFLGREPSVDAFFAALQ